MMEGDDAAPTMIEAIRLNRQDIVRSLAEHMAKLPDLGGILLSLHPLNATVDTVDGEPSVDGTLLHLATAAGQPDAVRTLLRLGSDPSVQDSAGRSAIELAALHPTDSEKLSAAFTTMFLQHTSQSEIGMTRRHLVGGIDVNGSDGGRKHNRPLHWACGFGTPEIVGLLCRNGAGVNVPNAEGGTPLHDAAERGDPGIIRVLLDHGADRGLRYTSGRLNGLAPVDVAAHSNPERLAEIKALLSDGSVKEGDGVPHPTDPLARDDINGAPHSAVADAWDHGGLLPAEPEPALASAKSSPRPSSSQSTPGVKTIRKTTDPRLRLLWPPPRRMIQMDGPYIVLPQSAKVSISCGDPLLAPRVEHVWRRLVRELGVLGVGATRVAATYTSATHIVLLLNPTVAPTAQMYRLSVEARGVTIVAGDVLGLHYGVTSFIQLVRLCKASPAAVGAAADPEDTAAAALARPGMPPVTIIDQPALLTRGYMLDVSRNKVPKMKTLCELVDLLVLFKFNQLQLYFEHTFAYSGHKIVWEGADPYHGHEMLALSEYCYHRGIALVPNQNSFGHFHRWLVHDRYRGLAECPDGADIGERPSGPRDAPFSLCPIDRGCIRLVQGLYAELSANFPHSDQIHVGLDETDDIGLGRSKLACSESGTDTVYMDYLYQIRNIAQQQRKTMLFWADMVQQMSDSTLADIPPDVVACEWGYEDDHPFDDKCRRLSDAGVAFMVCPGTSSWNALCGRTANCIQNIRGAVEAGVAHGAVGMLLTDWGDAGHTQPRALSYVGIVTGGGLAWNPSPAPVIDPEAHVVSAGDWIGEWGEKDVAKLLDTFVFWDVDTSVGTVLTELGNTYLHTGGGAAANNNGTALFRILMCSCRDSRSVPEGVTSAGLRSAAKHARDLTDALDAAGKSVRLKEDLEGIRIAVDMTVLACRMGQALLRHHCSMTALPLTQRTDFANRLIPLTGRLAAHWRQQNREGGFAETKKLLSESISVLLGPDGIAAVDTTAD